MTLVELDVASARLAATQFAAGGITAGQLDFEYVISARFALVAHADSRHARLIVDRDGVIDDPAIRVKRINRVSGDRCGFDLHATVMIDVVKVAPECAVLGTTRHTEVRLGAGRSAGNPAAAGDEVATRRCFGTAGNSSGR